MDNSISHLTHHDEALVDIVAQISRRIQAGEVLDLRALPKEHPDHEDELRELLPAIQMLTELGTSNEEPTDMVGVPRELVSGERALGDFLILEEIGRGGMGVVYKAEQISLRRHVALKILPFAGMLDERQLERFKNEARAAAMLKHSHIVSVYSVGYERGVHYFAMELVDGQSLACAIDQLRAGGDVPLTSGGQASIDTQPVAVLSTQRSSHSAQYYRSVARLGIQVAQSLEYAHQQGIIHRDIKPSNLLLDRSGKLWVSDFGLAQVQGDHNLTMTGDILGTLRYMSPEQAEGRKLLDERTDIYSLGVTLYELLTLRPPFRSDNRQRLLRQVTDDHPPSLRRHDRSIPTELETIVLKATAKQPEARYDTAGELADDLERYLDHKPIKARRITRWQVMKHLARRNPVSAALIATIALLLLFLAVAGPLVAWKYARLSSDALAQKERHARQISDELSAARALRGDVQSDSLPDSQTLRRALEAARRAQRFLSTGEVDEALSRQVTELLSALESQNRDQRLQAALERTWEWEMDRLAEQNESEWHPGFQLQTPALAGAATRYESAQASWGLNPDTTSLADAARRIQALRSAYQASMLVSLDRWRKLIGAPRSLRDWEQVEWSVLEPVKLTSRGGDSLQVQPDGSILASGDHPQRGYDLILETEQKDIVALRLEAMLDDSLPGRGPGRGGAGNFAVDGLHVSYAPRANPDSKRRLEYRSAVADYADPNCPLTAESWHIAGGGGKAHIAIFEVAEPVHNESGFRLTISHQDKDAGWGHYESQNLGRFRWSVSADQKDKRVAQWLAEVVDQADRDDWRRSMRSEIQRGDAAALVQRASDLQALQDQPEIILIQLAKALREIDETIIYGMLPDTINWDVLKPIAAESEGGAKLERQHDGSILTTDRNPFLDTVVITAPVGDRPITAIRLETIPDHRLPSGGAGRGLGGRVELVEFEAEVYPASDPDAKQRLAINRAIADYARSPSVSISKAVDGLRSTAWHIHPGRRQRHTGIFVATPPKAKWGGEMSLRICLETGWGWRALGRFRLSVTHDPIHLPDPKRAALTLLRRIHQQHPDNYWVNLALAETLPQQTPPAFDEALRYATAALALRPEKATPHATLVRVLPASELDPDHPLGGLAVFHARRARELAPDNASVQDAANQQTALGASLIKQRKLDEAIAKCNMAIGLQPDHVGAHFWLGIALATQGKLDEAIDAYRRTLAIDPNHYTAQANISHLLVRQGKLDEAIVAAQKALEIDPESAEGHRALSAALAAKGRLNEATDAYQRCLDSVRHHGRMGQAVDITFWHIESHPKDPFAHFEFGIVMLEVGEQDEAIDGFREALKHDPEHGMALLYLGNALRQQGSLDEAIQAYRKAISIDAEYAHAHRNLGIALMAQGNFRAARRALQKSMDISGGGDGRDWFFVAMSEWRLGNEEEARRWYDWAVRWMDENEPENEQLVETRGEAERTLGLKQNGAEQED